MKKLALKKEALTELSAAELDLVAGGTVSLNSCNPIVCVRTLEECVTRTILSCIVC